MATWDGRIEMVRVVGIDAPHAVTDSELLAGLVASMRDGGWTGRPVLLVAAGDGYRAVTGSHRIAAARKAGIREIPAVVIGAQAYVDGGHEIEELDKAADDDERRAIIRDCGDAEALALMDAENA